MVRQSLFLSVALGALLLMLGAPAWGQVTPTAIGDQPYPWNVSAHVDADGTARVGYLTGGDSGLPSVLWAAAAAPGQPFGRARSLLRIGSIFQTASNGQPVFAWDGAGRAIVAWNRPVRKPRAQWSVFVSVQSAEGRFGAPRRVSDRSHLSRYPVLAVDPAGHAIVAWETNTHAGWRVEAALRRSGAARFGRRRIVSRAARGARGPLVAIAPGGQAIIAWRDRRVVGGARASVSTGVGQPLVLGPWRGRNDELLESDDIDTAIGPDGTALVTWRNETYPRDTKRLQAVAALLEPSGRITTRNIGASIPNEIWVGGELVDADMDIGPLAAVTPQGEAIVAAPRTAGHTYLGMYTAAPGAMTWSPPQPIGAWDAGGALLETTPDGSAVLAWSEDAGGDTTTSTVATRPPGGSFGAPLRITTSQWRVTSVAAGPSLVLIAWNDLTAAVVPMA